MTTAPRGRADLHIHSLASDGVSSVAHILDAAELAGIDVIAITDHDRIEAAVAAQALIRTRDSTLEVVLGEEVSSRSGHVVALFIEERIRPWQSLRATVAQIHAQGGLAIIAHPLVPYPLCASGRSIRRLLADSDPAVHPDGMEAFNPTTARMRWSQRAPAFADEVGLTALASSDAHRAADIGLPSPPSRAVPPPTCATPSWPATRSGRAGPTRGGHRSRRSASRWPSVGRLVRDHVKGAMG